VRSVTTLEDESPMFGRSWIVFVLGAAALLPYAISQPAVRNAVTSPLTMVSKEPSAAKPAEAAAQAPYESGGFVNHGGAKSPAAPQPADVAPRTSSASPTIPFEQALRWDVKPAWVLGNWPRVTTHLPELELQGYRVSYVSGTTESDLAGVLTYYFNEMGHVERLAFHGTTGDARRFVQFMLSYHKFERRFGDDPSTFLYQVEQDGKALSELRVKTAPVVRRDSPLDRFEVMFEIRRPEE
jgi:hypothetical protein